MCLEEMGYGGYLSESSVSNLVFVRQVLLSFSLSPNMTQDAETPLSFVKQ